VHGMVGVVSVMHLGGHDLAAVEASRPRFRQVRPSLPRRSPIQFQPSL
jgi:hypothetical protein